MALIGGNRSERISLLVAMGLFGAALIYGDGIITPAISVLSALEGVNVATDALKPYVMPMAVAILLGLFALQMVGTARIGTVFGPVMLLWFIVIAILGVSGVAHRPEVLASINPFYAVAFLAGHGWSSFVVLGGVFLAIT
jgi:KUP system potassium uptake protein